MQINSIQSKYSRTNPLRACLLDMTVRRKAPASGGGILRANAQRGSAEPLRCSLCRTYQTGPFNLACRVIGTDTYRSTRRTS